ncbi:MAG TPA: ATP-binding protein [Myxococcales bacterium]|jgi:two-component system NtrC family sensor kinase
MNRSIPWVRRLGSKLAALIALLTLVVVGFFALMAIRAQRQYAVAELERGSVQLIETIKSSIYHHMLADERQTAYLTMETIGRQKGIDSVRMYNATGRITFSKHVAEVGVVVDRKATACAGCHAASGPGPLPTMISDQRIEDAPDGHRVLGVATPILNEKSCWTAACHAHPEVKKVLGVLDMGVSLEEADQGILSLERQTLAIAAGSIILLVVAVLLFVRASVMRPIKDLVDGTRRVAEGNLAGEIPIRSRDELAVLARSFNDMTGSLRMTGDQLQALMENLEKQVQERTAALRQAQDQLVQSEKMSSLGKLSASIAHEINNPLMGILTTAKLLVRIAEGEPASKPRDASLRQLRMVQRETERCSAIVRNLLDFARQRPLALKDVDVNAAIEEALSVSANQAAIQGVRVDKQLGTVPTVQADLGQLRQAFLNIALNGIDAMGKGGTLKVVSRLSGDKVEVEMSDTGAGIAPEHLQKIFDPFFTTKEKGTGLGLSVVFGIVQRHGGKVDVKSTVGQGTSITIALPRQAPASAMTA